MNNQEIIAAIATPPGRGGIGIVRVSGKDLRGFAEKILGVVPKQRFAHFCKFYDADAQVIDEGIALYYRAPHSYTGEDVLELQGHGSPAIMSLLLSRCMSVGARLAQPGEFTLRAFLNGKIDLVQAESVADIINAKTEQAARNAMQSLQGVFSSKVHQLVSAVTELRVLIEATLDFPEEETVHLQTTHVAKRLENICTALQQVLNASKQGKLLQEGVRVVFVGNPNVGKSSLMNQLSGDDISIVTDVPGTTRDAIQQTIQIEGVPMHLIDTAGLRETEDVVEKSGIERTHKAIEKADLIIVVMDASDGQGGGFCSLLANLPAHLPRMIVYNKIDLLDESPALCNDVNGVIVRLSAKTGAGVALLRRQLLEMVGWQANLAEEDSFVARQRHLEALQDAKVHLQNALVLVQNQLQIELLAEELRLVQAALASVTGRFTADDLLTEIFANFCIGK